MRKYSTCKFFLMQFEVHFVIEQTQNTHLKSDTMATICDNLAPMIDGMMADCIFLWRILWHWSSKTNLISFDISFLPYV